MSKKSQKEKALGFGHRGSSRASTQYKREEMKSEIDGNKLQISLLKRAQRSPLVDQYNVAKYDLRQGYEFPENLQNMIPSGTPEYIDHGERYVERISRALHHFKQCALIGPTGTGKTHVVYIVAEIHGLPIWEINCGLQTSTYDLFGRYIGLGKENWVDGQIVSWLRNGGILYLDEANMMKQDIAARLNPILDTRGHLILTEKDNEIIKRHPYGYVIIAMNPFSYEFIGTKPLNAAFRRRMTVWINFAYLSVGNDVSRDEIELIQRKCGIDEDTAYRIVRVGAELRRQYLLGDLPYGPSLGDLVNWGIVVSDGMTPLAAAEETIITMTSDNFEVQEAVRKIVRMNFA